MELPFVGQHQDWALVAVGFAVLLFGAECLVHGAVALALRLRVSPLLIGVTIVAYGTSTPELFVSVDAALKGLPGIAVGNVVGSNIFNILAILGLTALIAPITVSPRAIARDGLFALAAALLFIWVASRQSILTADEGILFLAVMVGIVLATYSLETARAEAPSVAAARRMDTPLKHSALLDILLIAAGIGLLIIGSTLLVDGAAGVARKAGISETTIGLTLVAAGTSLPELATSVVAALRRNSDIALGNIVGSNIYNILAILGLTALFSPVAIDPVIVRVDNWVMLAATLALFPPLFMGNRITRIYGFLMFAAYVVYVAYLLSDPSTHLR